MSDPYDEIPYPGSARPQTHPDRLATMARVFGMAPPSISNCRVLELGSGDGANLVPMAFGLPGSEFVGVELAARPCEEARRFAGELGLSNITFHCMDVADAGGEIGKFDYIIAHGLYSWVPEPVREKILELAGRHLTPNGVAYVSYNAFPGGHVRRMIREMLLYHVRGIEEPRQRTGAAASLLEKLSSEQTADDEYRAVMKKEYARVARMDPGHFFHDDLAEHNEPVWFSDFIERAGRHGLQYLSEADYHQMQPPLGAPLPRDDDIVRAEQYWDFLRCRRFRRTLLCREDVRLRRDLDDQSLAALYAACRTAPVSDSPDMSPGAPEEFRVASAAGEGSIQTDHALGKAILVRLGAAWPSLLPVSSLSASHGGDDSREAVASFLIRLWARGVLDLRTQPPNFALEPGERPTASPVARLQLRTQRRVTNLCHQTTDIPDETTRQLLLALDGTRDRPSLRSEMERLPGGAISGEQLHRALDGIARQALLVS